MGARDGIPAEGRCSPFRFEFARLGVQRTQWEYLLTNLRLFREMYLHITGGINIKGSRSAAPNVALVSIRGGPAAAPEEDEGARCPPLGVPTAVFETYRVEVYPNDSEKR